MGRRKYVDNSQCVHLIRASLPSGGRVFVSRRLGWHPPRLDLPNNRSGQADVVLPAVAKEQLQISVRVPGFKVLTDPAQDSMGYES